MSDVQLNSNFKKYSETRFVLSATLTLFFGYMQIAFFTAYAIIYLELNLLTSITIISIIVSMRNILQLLFRVSLGEMSQLIGRKPLMLFGNLCFSLSLLFTYLATSWILVFIAVVALGIGLSSFWPACFSYLGDVNQDKFGENNGKLFQGMDLGLMTSSILAIILLDFLYFDLREIFGIFFIIGLIFLFLDFFFLPETLEVQKLSIKKVFSSFIRSELRMFSKIRTMSTKPILKRVFLLQLIISFTEFMMTAFFPVLIVKKGFSKATVAFVILISTVLLVGLKPYLGRISDKFGFELPVIMFILIASFATITLTLMTDLYLIIIVYSFVTGSVLTCYTAVNGAASKYSSNKDKGLALGVLGFWVSFGRALSTLLMGPVWEFFSIQISFQMFSIVIILVIISYWLVIYRPDRISLHEPGLN